MAQFLGIHRVYIPKKKKMIVFLKIVNMNIYRFYRKLLHPGYSDSKQDHQGDIEKSTVNQNIFLLVFRLCFVILCVLLEEFFQKLM